MASDFTRFVAWIRKQGITVYGFGERKTNPAFIAACNKFVPKPEEEAALTTHPTPGHEVTIRVPSESQWG
jgi:hypothetical protein